MRESLEVSTSFPARLRLFAALPPCERGPGPREKHTAHGSEAEPLSDHLGQAVKGNLEERRGQIKGPDQLGELFSPEFKVAMLSILSLGLKIRDELLRNGTGARFLGLGGPIT
jgi:hypothetical protein